MVNFPHSCFSNNFFILFLGDIAHYDDDIAPRLLAADISPLLLANDIGPPPIG